MLPLIFDAIPGNFEEYYGLSHLAPLEQPQIVNRTMADFPRRTAFP